MDKIEWIPSTEWPDELAKGRSDHSVDVLIYNLKTDERTIGWYNFDQFRWLFLNNERITKFQWRYFVDAFDKPTNKKQKTNCSETAVITSDGCPYDVERPKIPENSKCKFDGLIFPVSIFTRPEPQRYIEKWVFIKGTNQRVKVKMKAR